MLPKELNQYTTYLDIYMNDMGYIIILYIKQTTQGSTTYINAATCTQNYDPINLPIILTLPLRWKLNIYFLLKNVEYLIWKYISGLSLHWRRRWFETVIHIHD